MEASFNGNIKLTSWTCRCCENTFDTEAATKLESVCNFAGAKCCNETKLTRFRCPSYGVVAGPIRMLNLDHNQLHQEYKRLYEWWNDGSTASYELAAFRAINEGGSYLNWGSGARDDSFVKTIEEFCAKSYYYDLSPNESLADSEIFVRDISKFSNFFDGIYSNNMVEHLLNPIEEFKKMNRCLKMGGKMCHRSDAWDYSHDHTHFHVHLNLRVAASIIAGKSGFRVTYRDDKNFIFMKVREV